MLKTIRAWTQGWLSAGCLAVGAVLVTGGESQAQEPRWGTQEFYEMRAGDPVGVRQHYWFGKVWPVQPRPVGRRQLLVHKFHAVHYWPHPYNELDAASVREISGLQVRNGWEAATTLYDYHFQEQTQELNSAGKKQLAWIVLFTPPEYRSAFVASTMDSAVDNARLATVQREAAKLGDSGGTVPISLRSGIPNSQPGDRATRIHEQYLQNLIPPKIEYKSGPGGGNASSSSM